MKRNAFRTALSLTLIALYAAGLAAMFMGNVSMGLMLWVVSTLGGIGLLFWIREMNKRAADAEKIARGMPYGEPDDPTAPVNPVAPKEGEAP